MHNILMYTNFTFLSFVALSFFLYSRRARDSCRSQSDTETPLVMITLHLHTSHSALHFNKHKVFALSLC